MQLTSNELLNYIKNKSVIILGSAPSVVFNRIEFMESFDIIVRLNNYKFFNDCKRINIYYSYFGRNIKKTMQEIINDNVNFIICKCPNDNFTEHNNGKIENGISDDFRWIYKYRKGFFQIPFYISTLEDFKENYKLINRILTTGMSAIIDILRFNPKKLYVTGFDFFESKIHNIDEPWKENDGGHDNEGEKRLFEKLISEGKIENCNN